MKRSIATPGHFICTSMLDGRLLGNAEGALQRAGDGSFDADEEGMKRISGLLELPVTW